ncbi:MAG TPA: hypothetical protein PK397_08105 [Ignavibacteriaceae bacterium]|jgi:hypothetical protein|nr:hypothetical protein [Ignavibacteriaceae bacterium]
MKKVFLSLLIVLFIAGCADKFDISQFDTDERNANIGGDTVYIQLTPNWEGFNRPQDVFIGFEPFVYVADTDNDRIVMLNLSGDILGIKSIKKPIAISQDYKLNLIVCAEYDTLVNGGLQTFSAVYKIMMVEANHILQDAQVVRLLPRSSDFNYPNRKYTGVVTFYDNSFLVARQGPSNSSIFDPDNSLLIFHPKSFYGGGSGDTLIGRVANIDPISSGLISANQISSMTSLYKKNFDFIATLTGNNSFKAQWFNYEITALGEKYVSRFTPSDGVGFVVPNKFGKPEGCWVDASGNIYVADAQKDSIYKFNAFGEEQHSFGGPSIFNAPHGVAVFDKTLYVADTGNSRILRFNLSTDIQ